MTKLTQFHNRIFKTACLLESTRGHSPSRLTCTSAPTFCLDCCVFQRMLECDSCQSVVWWIRSCSGGQFMTQHRFVFSCFGFCCWLGLVSSAVWCDHCCVHLDRRTRTCKVTTSHACSPGREKRSKSVSLRYTRDELLSARPARLTPDIVACLWISGAPERGKKEEKNPCQWVTPPCWSC